MTATTMLTIPAIAPIPPHAALESPCPVGGDEDVELEEGEAEDEDKSWVVAACVSSDKLDAVMKGLAVEDGLVVEEAAVAKLWDLGTELPTASTSHSSSVNAMA
jgi:hypothetical protein